MQPHQVPLKMQSNLQNHMKPLLYHKELDWKQADALRATETAPRALKNRKRIFFFPRLGATVKSDRAHKQDLQSDSSIRMKSPRATSC